jgi:hypothetical protein
VTVVVEWKSSEDWNLSKPGDLFVGATDFFSVLLPGVALTFVLLWRFGDLLGLALLGEKTWQAAAFLTVAYILGHFVDLIGAVALDRIYDLTYAGWAPQEEGGPFGRRGPASGGRRYAAEQQQISMGAVCGFRSIARLPISRLSGCRPTQNSFEGS